MVREPEDTEHFNQVPDCQQEIAVPKFAFESDLVKRRAHSVEIETTRLDYCPNQYISTLIQRRHRRDPGCTAIAGAGHVKVESLHGATLEMYVLGVTTG